MCVCVCVLCLCVCVCVCVCGCVGVGVCGCVGVWVCGCVGVWVCGCGCHDEWYTKWDIANIIKTNNVRTFTVCSSVTRPAFALVRIVFQFASSSVLARTAHAYVFCKSRFLFNLKGEFARFTK